MDPNNGTPTAVTIIYTGEPPPFPAAPRSVDFGPLKLILGILALITIPVIIYAFFFTTPCFSSSSSDRRRRRTISSSGDLPTTAASTPPLSPSVVEESSPKPAPDSGIEETCAVCLSELRNGDEIRLLSACNHAFHAACVDHWLNSKSNCPICRAAAPSPGRFVNSIGNDHRRVFADHSDDASIMV